MFRFFRSLFQWTLVLAAGAGRLLAADFEDEVLPIFTRHCTECHGPDIQMAGLGLHDVDSILRGGANGAVVAAGAPDQSALVERIQTGSMPLGDKPKLDAAQIRIIRDWVSTISTASLNSAKQIDSEYVSSITAKDREFWSFRPLDPPTPPQTDSEGASAVDAFLLEKLSEKELTYSAEAPRARLIRRATFDLIGLPPEPAEVEAFEQDQEERAYERVIDRLLASPHFGERWGRHWLDIAGYVDTIGRDVQANGYQVGPGRWRYRDYVVESFNLDKPYDRFLQEQLAGDQLVDWRGADEYSPEIIESLTATGYLRTVEDPTNADERNTELLRYSVLHQTIEIMTSGITGLTVACARCHTHKFDPIPQRDYYRLMAVLAPAYNPQNWIQPQDRFLADVPPAERERIDRLNAALDEKIKPLKTETAELIARGESAFIAAQLAGRAGADRADVEAALAAPAKKRSAEQKLLIKQAGLESIAAADALSLLTPHERSRHDELLRLSAELESKKQSYNKIEALYDDGPAPAIRLHQRGDHESLGAVVPPGGLEVLEEPGDGPKIESSEGPRLALARWLTDPDTRAGDLVARVMVNHVWAHLFGEGIVSTVDNFGVMGAPPSHPQLLEWLASEFQRSGWRIKPLIRRLMLSQAYRQDSTRVGRTPATGPDPAEIDPDNRLLWRMRTRRLESEIIRDSMLAASGKLDDRLGGPPIPTRVKSDGMVVFDDEKIASTADRYRRSLYLVARRRFSLSMLGVFDHPVMSTNATHRSPSAVVLQSLMMLNDAEVNEQARFLAQRVSRTAGDEIQEQIRMAFRFALGRRPAPEEIRWAQEFYSREAGRFEAGANPAGDSPRLAALGGLCHVLMNSNEFLYVQ